MTVRWADLVFTPSSEALHELRTSWAWLLPADSEPVLFSILGDVFFRTDAVYWLNTGTASITRVAETVEEFEAALPVHGDDWFLPPLVQALHDQGKVPAAGECYTYAILPIFAEGKYEPWNFKPVPAAEHFAATAQAHRQVAELPEGAQVQLQVGP